MKDLVIVGAVALWVLLGIALGSTVMCWLWPDFFLVDSQIRLLMMAKYALGRELLSCQHDLKIVHLVNETIHRASI